MFNVTFISQSEKKGIKRVQAVLDRYAIRISDNTWNTDITQEGLKVVYETLKKITTKQVAVCCYKKTKGNMVLFWSLGKTIQREGNAISVHKHKKEKKYFNPHHVRIGSICLRIAGLFHDVGKINSQFQEKLSSSTPQADDIRHELISYFIFHEYCDNPNISFEEAWKNSKQKIANFIIQDKNFNEFKAINNWQDLTGFLILTHHRLLTSARLSTDSFSLNKELNLKNYYQQELEKLSNIELIYDKNKFSQIEKNINTALSLMKRNTINSSKSITDLNFWFATSIFTRACFIFADHEQSGIKLKHEKDLNSDDIIKQGKVSKTLYANTTTNYLNKRKYYNQDLNWHLNNVARRASEIIIEASNMNLPSISDNTIDKLLNPCAIDKFLWQNEVVNYFSNIKEQSLILNLAGTGAGKTRANVLALAALNRSQERKFRFSTALNLRSLTLQTIDSYKNQLGFSGNELIGIIGDDNVSKLFTENNNKSSEPLKVLDTEENDNDFFKDYKVSNNEQLTTPQFLDFFLGLSVKKGNKVTKLKTSNKKSKILAAPALVSTIDFLNDAGDLRKQGNHSLSLLRLMHNDLILDEIDSYEPEALVSVCRIIMLSAMFGNNIIVSSATLSQNCAAVIKIAFEKGCALNKSLNISLKSESSQREKIFFISNHQKPEQYNYENSFLDEYSSYIERMLSVNNKSTKKAMILKCDQNQNSLYEAIVKDTLEKHESFRHSFDNKKISFGLIRLGNIKNVVSLTQYLSEHPLIKDKVKICCYHSQHTLLQRQYIEEKLEFLLNRKGEVPNFKKDDDFKKEIDNFIGEDIIFIVVASPVAEIGRDFDFDWGICEPSSTQSIVQTAGRINRHREVEVKEPNFSIMEWNLNSLTENKNDMIFYRPGLDHKIKKERQPVVSFSSMIKAKNKTQSMTDLIDESEISHKLDASLKFKKDIRNKEKHLFSELDNFFLSNRLQESEKIFSNSSLMYHFYNADFHKKYLLRDKNGQIENYIHIQDSNNVTLNYYDKGVLYTQPYDVSIEKTLENSWLIASDGYIRDKQEILSIDDFDSYSIRINSYDIFKENLIYSPSLGLYKKSRTK